MTEVVDANKARVEADSGQVFERITRDPAGPDLITGLRLSIGFVTGAVVLAVAVGFLVRLIAALTLSAHVDEASSVLAAHVVAEHGIPVLPSGTPYFQGVTLSYLLAPFVWLGAGEIEHLHVMRLVLVMAGAITIYLCYRLGEAITGDARVGGVMAALVAIDPVSVQWSGHVRMYGLLQALAIALVWAYTRLINGNTSWRQVGIVVTLYWAAVFTHVGAALLGPAMVVAAWIIHRRGLLRQYRLLTTFALSAVGPAVLLGLNSVLATGNEPVRESTSIPLWSFVGDNLLAPMARLRLPMEDWQSRIAAGATLYWLIPVVIVAAATIIGARYLFHKRDTSNELRTSMIVLLSFYWFPMAVILIFTVSPKIRYLLHTHLIGYLFVSVLIVALLRRVDLAGAKQRIGLNALARSGLVLAIVLAVGSGLAWRLDNPVVQPDYNEAMAYVAEHHEPGSPVVITLPPIGYLSIDDASRDDVYFLAGSEGWTRADRYTRWAMDGRLIDYWVGADSIVSTQKLQDVLEDHPDAWVIADEVRLTDDWAGNSSIKRVIRESMFPVYSGDGGAVVYRAMQPSAGVGDGLALETLLSDAGAFEERGVGCDSIERKADSGGDDCRRLPATPHAEEMNDARARMLE